MILLSEQFKIASLFELFLKEQVYIIHKIIKHYLKTDE